MENSHTYYVVTGLVTSINSSISEHLGGGDVRVGACVCMGCTPPAPPPPTHILPRCMLEHTPTETHAGIHTTTEVHAAIYPVPKYMLGYTPYGQTGTCENITFTQPLVCW